MEGVVTYGSSYNLAPPFSRVMIGRHLIFCSQSHQRSVTQFQNVGQLNIRWAKNLGFQLSHRQPLNSISYIRKASGIFNVQIFQCFQQCAARKLSCAWNKEFVEVNKFSRIYRVTYNDFLRYLAGTLFYSNEKQILFHILLRITNISKENVNKPKSTWSVAVAAHKV